MILLEKGKCPRFSASVITWSQYNVNLGKVAFSKLIQSNGYNVPDVYLSNKFKLGEAVFEFYSERVTTLPDKRSNYEYWFISEDKQRLVIVYEDEKLFDAMNAIVGEGFASAPAQAQDQPRKIRKFDFSL